MGNQRVAEVVTQMVDVMTNLRQLLPVSEGEEIVAHSLRAAEIIDAISGICKSRREIE